MTCSAIGLIFVAAMASCICALPVASAQEFTTEQACSVLYERIRETMIMPDDSAYPVWPILTVDAAHRATLSEALSTPPQPPQ